MRVDLMQRGKFICHSERCGGREFTAIPGLESTCPLCGSSEIELQGWLDDGRLAHLTSCGSVCIKAPRNDIPESERLAFRKRTREQIDEIIGTLPQETMYRIDRSDGLRGGYFRNPAIAVNELF